MPQVKPHSKAIRLVYFWVGIGATFLYRIIIVLNHYSQTWVQIAWYLGTIGFIIYFSHRYRVSERRSQLITKNNLDEKVKNLSELNQEEKDALRYILQTLRSTKEKWNYIFIFVASGIALAWGIYTDFISPLLKTGGQ